MWDSSKGLMYVSGISGEYKKSGSKKLLLRFSK